MDVQTVKLFEGNIEQIVQVINCDTLLLEDTSFENSATQIHVLQNFNKSTFPFRYDKLVY